jgi:hypothetical protein
MASLLTALLTLACLCAGTVLGSLIRSQLPDHHLRDDSKDVVKMASGMIATLVALVIGLLVSSSKSSFDQASSGVSRSRPASSDCGQPIGVRSQASLRSSTGRAWMTSWR